MMWSDSGTLAGVGDVSVSNSGVLGRIYAELAVGAFLGHSAHLAVWRDSVLQLSHLHGRMDPKHMEIYPLVSLLKSFLQIELRSFMQRCT